MLLPQVCVTGSKHMLRFALGSAGAKPYLELNRHHYTKLLDMFRRTAGAGASEVDHDLFHARVWLLLARCAGGARPRLRRQVTR